MNVVAMRLRELRDRLGYSQEGMAAPIGMEQTAWSRWEKTPPEALSWLKRIAEHYGISANYLLGISDDPTLTVNTAGDGKTIAELHSVVLEMSESRRREVLAVARALKEFDREETKDLELEMYDRMMGLIEQVGGLDAVEALETALRADAAGDSVGARALIDAFFAGRDVRASAAKKPLKKERDQV